MGAEIWFIVLGFGAKSEQALSCSSSFLTIYQVSRDLGPLSYGYNRNWTDEKPQVSTFL